MGKLAKKKKNVYRKYFVGYLSSTANTVEDAEKWLKGLELLRQETLVAHTPEIIERYTHTLTESVPRVSMNRNPNYMFVSFSVFILL